MAKQLFRGDWKKGEVIEDHGKFYIAEFSQHYNAHEMEDGFDIALETGYYTTAHEMVSDEDKQIVKAQIDREAARIQAIRDEHEQVAMAGKGTFSVGQDIRYKNAPTMTGTIVEIASYGALRIKKHSGSKAVSWIEPGYVEVI